MAPGCDRKRLLVRTKLGGSRLERRELGDSWLGWREVSDSWLKWREVSDSRLASAIQRVSLLATSWDDGSSGALGCGVCRQLLVIPESRDLFMLVSESIWNTSFSSAPESRGLKELGGSRMGWRKLVEMEGKYIMKRTESPFNPSEKRHSNYKDVTEPLN